MTKQYVCNGWSAALAAVMLMALSPFASAQAGDRGATDADGNKIDYAKMKNPVAFTEKSIKRGKSLYMRTCTGCHGTDGKSQLDVIADATDLTVPKYYRSGSKPGEIFRSIKEGAGLNMPPYKFQIKKDDDIWHMVNYVQSIWPAKERPKLVKPEDEKAEKDEESSGDATTDGQE